MKDSDPRRWVCPPHTKAKHDMLGRYLDAWFPILSSWNGRVVFLDGFAGRGRYEDGAEGSPLVALRHLLDHHFWPRMQDREFVFFFIEADADNANSLQTEIDAFKADRAPWPSTVKVHVINEKFDVSANSLLEVLRAQKRNLAPTFAFVDPFGYSGLPMHLLAELLDYPCSELFVNFMVGHVQRFIERDGQENAITNLFGMNVQSILASHDGIQDRVEHLGAVYAKQLQDVVGFSYVQSFAMRNSTGNVGYYLLHGTKHVAGVRAMKAAMWSIDPGGGNMFSDRLAGQAVLFEATPDLEPLRAAIVNHFTGKGGVLIDAVEEYTLLNTPYRDTHVRSALRPLEKAGHISVDRPGKSGYPSGKARINFS